MAAPKQRNKKPQSKWTIIRRVNVLFRRANRREMLTFLSFTCLAFGIWLVLAYQEQSAQEFIVSLNIVNQPQDKVFTTFVPTQLRVTLSDTNGQLFFYRYDDRMERLSIEFERYADASGDFRVSAAELKSILSEELPASTQILSVSPNLLDAKFAQTEGRKYPVQLSNHYLPTDNYRLHQIQIVPDSVVINAPNSVLDTMRCVYATASRNIDQLTDTLTETLTLELPLGVKATPNHVKVTVPVSKYVEKVLTVELKALGAPRGLQLMAFPYMAQVSCLVDFGYYRTVREEDFDVVVECPEGVKQGQHGYLPISVCYKGEDTEAVTNVTVKPEMAEYVVEHVVNYPTHDNEQPTHDNE